MDLDDPRSQTARQRWCATGFGYLVVFCASSVRASAIFGFLRRDGQRLLDLVRRLVYMPVDCTFVKIIWRRLEGNVAVPDSYGHYPVRYRSSRSIIT